MIKFVRGIMNTWNRLDELERKIHDIESYIVDEKSKKAQNTVPALSFSDDRGEVWFKSKEDYIESRR